MKNLSLTLTMIAFAAFLSTTGYSQDMYSIDIASSQLKWTGYHLAKSYEHNGLVKLKAGNLVVSNGEISSGEFVIDMSTITNTDLTNAKDNAKLVNHLKSDDFFAVKTYPEVRLLITGSEGSNGKLRVTGDLTIRGITKSITFDAHIAEQGAGKVEATADLKINRTDYKVMWGWKIENAMLSDEFRMEVKLVGKADDTKS